MARVATALACAAALSGSLAQQRATDPWPDPGHLRVGLGDEKLSFLSSTLGDHMVLQKAPASAVVWGHTTPGAEVETLFDGQSYKVVAGVDGVWRQRLPPKQASTAAYTLKFSSSSGDTAELNDVLFGDVYVCGGQSNMQHAIPAATNAAEEIKIADQYPYIRLFTVGQGTSSATPLDDLQTIEQTWAVASSQSIAGPSGFSYFSSVCWFFGRTLSDKLAPGRDMPIGLISNNWGGTYIQQWSTPGVIQSCNRTVGGKDTQLYNAMIHPYTVGPMAISGFTWYQGEANTGDPGYACLFPAMITDWRNRFSNPDAYFGFVQLSTWCYNGDLIAQTREFQMSALQLPKVGYATNADHGAGCDIHPPAKQFCGQRLAASALALQYGQSVAWRSPTFTEARQAQAAPGMVAVAVSLQDVGADGLMAVEQAYNAVPGLDCAAQEAQNPRTCAWAGIEVSGSGWLNATASVTADGREILLQAPLPAASANAEVLTASYGWGAIPMLTIYDKATGLPVLPFKRALSASAPEQLLV